MSLFGDILPINKSEEKKRQQASLSPYLNFDPNYIPKMQPEFIYPDDSHMASTARRSNVALPIIGMSFMTGSGMPKDLHVLTSKLTLHNVALYLLTQGCKFVVYSACKEKSK